MGNFYSADHNAEDHIQTYNAKLRNHNRSTALERSVIDYWDNFQENPVVICNTIASTYRI